MNKSKKEERVGLIKINKWNDVMKIIEYNDYDNIIVEFQDKYKAKVHTKYGHFLNGGVKNPYRPNVYGVGAIGNKYQSSTNGKCNKEYILWIHMLQRCFDKKFKERCPSYQNVTCCEEWLNYENFYEWIHSQSNFDKWYEGKRWALDKDILNKGNKIYSPNTCCLVSQNINCLFTKRDASRGDLPIGVSKHRNKYRASFYISDKHISGLVKDTPEEAFLDYKQHKENAIKQIAKEEYEKGNITKKCYDAIMRYEVEITD